MSKKNFTSRKHFVLLQALSVLLFGCAKIDFYPQAATLSEEDLALNQSVFSEGSLAPEAAVREALSGGDTGVIGGPIPGGSSTDGGVIAAPGSGGTASLPTTPAPTDPTSSGSTPTTSQSTDSSGSTASNPVPAPADSSSGSVASNPAPTDSSSGSTSGSSSGENGTIPGPGTGSGSTDGGTVVSSGGSSSGSDSGSNTGSTSGGTSTGSTPSTGGVASNDPNTGSTSGTTGGSSTGNTGSTTGSTGGTSTGSTGTDGGTVAGGGTGTSGTDGGTSTGGPIPLPSEEPGQICVVSSKNSTCKEIDVSLSRICSANRSNIVYPRFVFFEELKNPVMSIEAIMPQREKEMKFPLLAGLLASNYLNPTAYQSSSLMSFMIAKVNLTGVDLFEGRWRKKIQYSLDGLKKYFPKDWQSTAITASVCEDRDRDGFCTDENAPWKVSVSDPMFLPKDMPRALNIDVWHGRYYTIAEDPEFCEKQYSPIVLDLSGDGIKLVGPESGPRFDLNDTGTPVITGWTGGADEAFLVRDVNRNGRIDSGAELFGSATRLANGKRAANGFEALSEHDSNADGIISPKDRIWSELRLWIDSNRNGKSESSELYSLDRSKIESMNLAYVDMNEVDSSGNATKMRSTFRRTVNGKSVVRVMVDVWFNTLVSHTGDVASR